MPSLLTSCALVGAVSLGLGQATTNTHTVSGQVVNSVTGQPIARALVEVGQHSMLTDHEGRFAFEEIGEGEGAAFATRPGYFSPDGNFPVSAQPLTLKLVPEAILFGTVTDAVGQPIQDLHVQLKRLQVRNGLTTWEQTESTLTNVEGEYRFAELQAGRYRVVTNFKVDGLPGAPSSVAFASTAYPPMEGDAAKGGLALAAGDRTEANLNPAQETLYPVTGVINGPVNRGVNIAVENAEGDSINATPRFFRESGTFRVMLPSGLYQLKVRSFAQPEPLFGTRDLSVGHGPLEGVSISLGPQLTIPVEVDYQDVATGAQHEATGPPSLNFTLESADPAGPRRSFPAEYPNLPGKPHTFESGGPLVVQNVEPGRYDMVVQGSQPWYLASASCDNVDLMRNPLVISAGAGACTIRAVARNDYAQLKWSIAPGDAGKVNGTVFVTALPLDKLAASAETSEVSAAPSNTPLQGEFIFLAPGRYLVVALPYRQEIPYRETDSLQKYSSLGQEVTLPRNGEAEVQLRVAGEP